MKHFKYLFFFFIFLSTFSNALTITKWSLDGVNYSYTSEQQACNSYVGKNYNNQKVVSVQAGNSSCVLYNSAGGVLGVPSLSKKDNKIECPSATEKVFKVPLNTGVRWCEKNCQYRLVGCVNIQFDSGGDPDGGDHTTMHCNGISTGSTCGSATNQGPSTSTGGSGGSGSGGSGSDTGGNPPITSGGANQNNDGSSLATNSANSTSTNTSTSTSTSTSTTENNTTTTTTTTNNTTITNTTTSIDLSSLENLVSSVGDKITNAINSLKESLGGDGKGDGQPDGQGSASSPVTDTSAIEEKLDGLKDGQDSLLDFLKGDGVGDNPFGSDAVPHQQLTQDSLKTNIFASNQQCPKDSTLSFPMGSRTFTYTFSFSTWCYWLSVLGSFILIGAYCYGAYIVVSKS